MGLVWDVQECNVNGVSEHDAESRPHLPHHHESATDGSWGTFCAVDGHCRGLRTDSKAKHEAGDEKMLPRIGDGLPDAGQEREGSRDEYGSSSAKELVQRIGDPASYESTAYLTAMSVRHGQEGLADSLHMEQRLRVRESTGFCLPRDQNQSCRYLMRKKVSDVFFPGS